jgi:hypothetical protein
VVDGKTASRHIIDKIISNPGDDKIKCVTMHVGWRGDILLKPIRLKKMNKISSRRVRGTVDMVVEITGNKKGGSR